MAEGVTAPTAPTQAVVDSYLRLKATNLVRGLAAGLPLNARGELDWRDAASWTPDQRAAAFAEDDARMICEGSGHWLDVMTQNIYIPDGDDGHDC